MSGPLYLSDTDVRALVDVRAVLDVVEDTFRWAHAGRVIWPAPRALRMHTDEPATAKYHVKAAVLPDLGISGVRVVGYRIFPDGSGTSRDDNLRYVLLHDPTSGQPLAIVDEHTSYGLRSAASGVVAARHLARADSSVVGLVGTGRLMRSALQALLTVFPVREVRVTSRSPERRAAFVDAFPQLPPQTRIVAVKTPSEAARDADIIMSATTAARNLLFDNDFGAGSFVCGLGQHEVAPDAFANFDKVVVDDWEQVGQLADFRQMAAAGVFDRAQLYAQMPDIVCGAIPGRTSSDERILVRTEGLVSQDIAVAHWLYQAALREGRGVRLA
jgi:ornithine cyclodeaminase/alanine dehydrogenase-like protein (mu-crystallin family)